MKQAGLFFSFLIMVFVSAAQSSNQADNGQRLARKIAQSVKDTLNLSGQQMNQLYDINLSLHNKKKQAMTSGLSRDSIVRRLQQIENTRDSLYKPVLGIDKYLLYREKKPGLLRGN